MVRQTLDKDAPAAYLYTALGAAGLYYRQLKGARANYLPSNNASQLPAFSVPGYLRLTRYGNTISAFISEDGKAYAQIAMVTFPLGKAYVGLSVDGGSHAICSATFSNYSCKVYDPLVPARAIISGE